MTAPENFEGKFLEYKSPYLFYNPENFMDDEVREWLSKSSVAHIAPLWLPLPRDGRTYGGAEDVVINNISRLDRYGIKKQLIFGHPNNIKLKNTFKSARVEIPEGIDPSADLLNILRTDSVTAERLERSYVLQSYQSIFDNSDEITIIHDHTSYGRDHGIWISQFVKPVVRTEHGPLVWPDTSKIEELNIRSFIGRTNLGFIAISEDQRSKIPDLNWVGVNYNGVDLNDFSYREEKDNYLLYLGRINQQKGIQNAIKAAGLAKMDLVIAGEVEETAESLEYFEKVVKPMINESHVYHLDKGVNAEERKIWLSRAKALLMLIEWDEPFGMVMAEALASGTPVVGYRKGSVPEIIRENTGYIVDDIFEAVESIGKIKQGRVSPVVCRKMAEKYFSAEAMASRYAKIYMDQTEKFRNKN